jgi:YD repeat-containing protein
LLGTVSDNGSGGETIGGTRPPIAGPTEEHHAYVYGYPDGSYTYDKQNRLPQKSGADGSFTYTYDDVGNLVKETGPDGSVTYTYNAQNRLVKDVLSDGQSSEYTYNALGVRVQNVQMRETQNAGYADADLKDGSDGVDYLDFLQDDRFNWQRVWESEVGTTVQNNFETVRKNFTVDYLSLANRDILVAEMA